MTRFKLNSTPAPTKASFPCGDHKEKTLRSIYRSIRRLIHPATNTMVLVSPEMEGLGIVKPVHHSGDDPIRERLLNKLGFFHGNSSPASVCSSSASGSSHPSMPSRGGEGGKMEVEWVPTPPPTRSRTSTGSTKTRDDPATACRFSPPKYLSLLDDSTRHAAPLHLEGELLYQPNKSIQFYPHVAVVGIPSHREYPQKVRRKLWSSSAEVQVNMERNSFEFEVDNWDWRKATEEDVFIAVNHELYHPATYRYQQMIAAAQQEHNNEVQEKKLKKKKKKKKRKKKGNITSKQRMQRGNGGGGGRGSNVAKNGFRVLTTQLSLTRFADT